MQIYTYSIRYKNGCGLESTTAGAQAGDLIASAPTQMNTTAVDNEPNLDTGVDISWVAPTNWGDNGVNPASRGFRVYRDTTDVSGLLPSSTLSHNDNTGMNNLSYSYHVEAANGCGLTISYQSMSAMDGVLQKAWAHAYGGSGVEEANAIQELSDDTYIIAGYTRSFGSGGKDFWIIKADETGAIQWQRAYGGETDEEARAIYQTSDGGYVVCGYTNTAPAQGLDIWVIKLDGTGALTWQKLYGGSQSETAYNCQQTSDGGYIVLGETNSAGAGGNDFWVLRLNSTGNIAWQYAYGGAQNEVVYPNSLDQTSDGGFIFTGATFSFGSYRNAWVIKISASGVVQWEKIYGAGTSNYEGHSVQETADGGYIVAGFVDSDYWVAKLTSDGTTTWQKRYDGAAYESARSVVQTNDGGYIVGGETNSFGGGSWDYWILKLSSSLDIIWERAYGGSNIEYARQVIQSDDGGYVVAGLTGSYPTNPTNYNYWILKLRSDGNISTTCGFISTTNAAWANTSVVGQIAGISVTTPAGVTVSDTYWSGMSVNGTDSIICKNSLAPGAVPDNDNYAGVPLTVVKSGGNLILSWGVPGGYCETEDYAIYRGSLPWTDYNHAFSVCTTGGMKTSTIGADTGSYYYLVVAKSGDNEGSYGLDSADIERPAAAIPCLEQEIGICN